MDVDLNMAEVDGAWLCNGGAAGFGGAIASVRLFGTAFGQVFARGFAHDCGGRGIALFGAY